MTAGGIFHPFVVCADSAILSNDVITRRPLVTFERMDGKGIDLQVARPRQRSKLVMAHVLLDDFVVVVEDTIAIVI